MATRKLRRPRRKKFSKVTVTKGSKATYHRAARKPRRVVRKSAPVTTAQWMALLRLMRKQIREDMADGTVPKNVSDYSTLHDYTDANFYGHREKFLRKRGEVDWVPGVRSLENMPESKWQDTIAAAQNAMDMWLRGPRTEVAFKKAAVKYMPKG